MIERIVSVAKKCAEIDRAVQIEIKQELFERILRTIKGAFDYANRLGTPEERAEAFANRLRVLAVVAGGDVDEQAEIEDLRAPSEANSGRCH